MSDTEKTPYDVDIPFFSSTFRYLITLNGGTIFLLLALVESVPYFNILGSGPAIICFAVGVFSAMVGFVYLAYISHRKPQTHDQYLMATFVLSICVAYCVGCSIILFNYLSATEMMREPLTTRPPTISQ